MLWPCDGVYSRLFNDRSEWQFTSSRTFVAASRTKLGYVVYTCMALRVHPDMSYTIISPGSISHRSSGRTVSTETAWFSQTSTCRVENNTVIAERITITSVPLGTGYCVPLGIIEYPRSRNCYQRSAPIGRRGGGIFTQVFNTYMRVTVYDFKFYFDFYRHGQTKRQRHTRPLGRLSS